MKLVTLRGETAIQYDFLWDGLSGQLTGPGTIHCKDGYITAVQSGHSEVLNSAGLTIMPALIDCHVHLAIDGRQDSLLARLTDMLNCGLIAAREGGSRHGMVSPPLSPLRLATCSQAIFKTGFYGQNLGIPVRSAEDALGKIDSLAKQGVQHIKLIASGIFSFDEYGETGPLPFSETEITTITRHAHSLGLRVMAHASGDEAVYRCVAAKVDSVEHGYFMSEETLKALVDQKIAWVPTLSPVAVQLDNPALCCKLTPAQRETVRRSLERHKSLVGKGAALGAQIGAGTDAGAAGVPHGPSLFWELMHLQDCGLSARQALVAATSAAAQICGFTQLGSLTPGKKAAILAVKGNPLQSLQILSHPDTLFISS